LRKVSKKFNTAIRKWKILKKTEMHVEIIIAFETNIAACELQAQNPAKVVLVFNNNKAPAMLSSTGIKFPIVIKALCGCYAIVGGAALLIYSAM
jgi:hypothetical protein